MAAQQRFIELFQLRIIVFALFFCLRFNANAAPPSGEYLINAPGDITLELIAALSNHNKVIVDAGSYTISDDVLVPGQRHIVIAPNAFIAFSDNPTIDNSYPTHESPPTRSGVGMFTFGSGTGGSHIECYGTIDINQDNIPNKGDVRQQASFVFFHGSHNSKVSGNCIIREAFNGISVIDSDDVYIQGVILTDPPSARNFRNAAVDVEASDRIHIIDTSAIGYEEVVDFNIQNYGGYVSVFGDSIIENAVEINNSVGITGYVWTENTHSPYRAHDYDIGNGNFRWSKRSRSTPDNKSNNIIVIDMDSGASEPPQVVTQCNDGIDNDADTFVDLNDPDCVDINDDNESTQPEGILYMADNQVSNTHNIGSNNPFTGVGFVVDQPGVITGIGIRGSQGVQGLNGNLRVSIVSNGLNPNAGTQLYSQVFSISNILPPYTTTPQMQGIVFSNPLNVDAGNYYLVVEAINPVSNDMYRWSFDSNNPSPTTGRWYKSASNHWQYQSNNDHNFIIYGIVD